MLKSINNLDQPGFVNDEPGITLPDSAWSDSRNVKYRDGAVEKCQGYSQALGSLSVTAIWAAPVTDGTNYFWVYGANTVLYATDGVTHANINGTITLSADDNLNFSGGAFHGFMIVNDGNAIPQSWTPGLANDLVSLTAWPSVNLTCRVMRPFKDFLFALRVTDTGVYNPREIRWSDRAGPGALPLSWDYADPTNQAGRNELAQTQDSIVDALPLRDSLMVYKENYSWIADYIGGDDIFEFRQVFSQVGMLTERCAIAFGSNHLVWTDQDIVLHDGNSARSIIDKRARRWLFNRINQANYRKCFAFADYRERTAYFCFPESGQTWPTLALCWNWAEDTVHPYDLGGPKTWADTGIVPGTSTTFDGDSGTFDSASGSFDDESYSPFSGYSLLTDSRSKKAYKLNDGETYDGVSMTCYAERTAFSIKRDLIGMMRVTRIFPRMSGTPGDVMSISVGVRTTQLTPVQWYGPYSFTLGVDYKIDLRVSGRLFDFHVEYTGSNTFRMHGFDIEFQPDGLR